MKIRIRTCCQPLKAATTQNSDPIADRVASVLIRLDGHRPQRSPGELIETAHDPRLDDDERQVLLRFLDISRSECPNLDQAEIALGQRMFVRNSILSATSLMLGSLMECYARPSIAQVLTSTKTSLLEPRARIYRSAQLVYDMMRPNSLQPGRRGHDSLVHIRLMHAIARQKFLNSMSTKEASITPIGQEDMVFTLLGFSLLVLRGLRRIGVRTTSEEDSAYYHLWRCAGWILGIDMRMLPPTLAQAWEAYRRLANDMRCPTKESYRLAQASLDSMASKPPIYLPRPVLYNLSRRLIGDRLADELQFPENIGARLAIATSNPLISAWSSLQQRQRRIERMTLGFGWRFARRSLYEEKSKHQSPNSIEQYRGKRVPSPFLAETPYCDFLHPSVARVAKYLKTRSATRRELAVRSFYFVRDSIIWELGNWNKSASQTLIDGRGSCSNKATLLTALLRANSLPAGFYVATVSASYFGPIIPADFLRLRRCPNKPTKHFYTGVHLDGKWLRADPTDDIGVFRCAPYVAESAPVEFDGRSDAQISIDPDLIHCEDGPLPSIDIYLSSHPINASGPNMYIARLCQRFIRARGASYHSVPEMHRELSRWLWRHNPILSCFLAALLWLRR